MEGQNVAATANANTAALNAGTNQSNAVVNQQRQATYAANSAQDNAYKIALGEKAKAETEERDKKGAEAALTKIGMMLVGKTKQDQQMMLGNEGVQETLKHAAKYAPWIKGKNAGEYNLDVYKLEAFKTSVDIKRNQVLMKLSNGEPVTPQEKQFLEYTQTKKGTQLPEAMKAASDSGLVAGTPEFTQAVTDIMNDRMPGQSSTASESAVSDPLAMLQKQYPGATVTPIDNTDEGAGV